MTRRLRSRQLRLWPLLTVCLATVACGLRAGGGMERVGTDSLPFRIVASTWQFPATRPTRAVVRDSVAWATLPVAFSEADVRDSVAWRHEAVVIVGLGQLTMPSRAPEIEAIVANSTDSATVHIRIRLTCSHSPVGASPAVAAAVSGLPQRVGFVERVEGACW